MRIRLSEKDAKTIDHSFVVVSKPTFKVGEIEYHTCVRVFKNFSEMVEVLRKHGNVFFFPTEETVCYANYNSPIIDKNISWILTYATIINE